MAYRSADLIGRDSHHIVHQRVAQPKHFRSKLLHCCAVDEVGWLGEAGTVARQEGALH